MIVKNQITAKKRYYDGRNPCKGATVHTTGNTRPGADAQAHANLQSLGNVRVASWHVQIDDTEAIQSYEDFRQCWHAGDGRGMGNTQTIGYELCVNSDGDYVQMLKNAAERIAMDAAEYGWTRDDIYQHNEFSTWGKNCPRELRGTKDDISWAEFVDMIFGHTAPKPKPPVKPDERDKADGKTDVDGWWGTDTTIELQDIFGTPIDGEVWRQPSMWASQNPALTNGWVWNGSPGDAGSPLIRAMQVDWLKGDYKGTVDGKIGPEFIKGVQRKLRRLGLYGGKIDGRLDAKSPTIKGLQKAINLDKIKVG